MNESKTISHDPICGTPVDQATALYNECDGKMIYFCSYFCRHEFLAKATPANLANNFESFRG
jgi:YHS domain-containing protein